MKREARLMLYRGMCSSGFLTEGPLKSLRQSNWGYKRRNERRVQAHETINESIRDDRLKIVGMDSLVETLEQARELTDYVADKIEAFNPDDSRRVLHHCMHGKILFDSYLHIPLSEKQKKKDLIDILLQAPYQPTIRKGFYIVAKLDGREISKEEEEKEQRKLWKKLVKMYTIKN